MTIKIRLARTGTKKKPHYRLVVANSGSPRNGKFLEKVGMYHPLLPKDDDGRVVLDEEKIRYWLSVGAQPTERVLKFLRSANLSAPKSKTSNTNASKSKASH